MSVGAALFPGCPWSAAQDHYVFNDLNQKTITDVVDVMKAAPIAAGTDIITQGEDGDLFYVMTSGSAAVIVDGNQVCGRLRRADKKRHVCAV